MPSIGSIDVYDGVENFKHYLKRIENYFIANDIGSGVNNTDATVRNAALAQRKAVFLTLIGKKTYHVLTNLLDPKTTDDFSYDAICKKLEDYYIPTCLEVAESYRFYRCRQYESESVVSYVSRLREAASTCNFGTFLSRALRDQFVSGVSSRDTQLKLLQETKSFEECIKIAVAEEAASKECMTFKQGSKVDDSVNFVKKKYDQVQRDKKSVKCTRCEGNHYASKCPKLSAICSYCNKKGHIPKTCFKKKHDEKSKSSQSGSQPQVYNLFNIAHARNQPLMVNVKIGPNVVAMEADSGASISIMSVNDFQALNFNSHVEYRDTDDSIRSVTGTEKIHSIVEVPVTVQGNVYKLNLRLLDKPCPKLFGRDWIMETGVSIDNIVKYMQTSSLPPVKANMNMYNIDNDENSGNEKSVPESIVTSTCHDDDNSHIESCSDNITDCQDEHVLSTNHSIAGCSKNTLFENKYTHAPCTNDYFSGSSDDVYYNVDSNELDEHRLLECLTLTGVNSNELPVTNTSIDKLLNKHAGLFSEKLGKFTKGEAIIHVDDNIKPKYCKARPLPYAVKDSVEHELMSMVKQGIISPVTYSDWACPIVPVQKSSGQIRVCGDFKATVNQVAETDKYPIPRIEDLYTKLAGGTIFSVLDLSMAYQQIVVAPQSRKYLTINTTKGLFTFNRLPAGISAAPGIFQRIMDSLFANVSGVVCYLDDILVSGKNEEDHNNNLDIVFQILKEAGFKLRKDKCSLGENCVKYLGHLIDSTGLHPLKSKVDAIKDAPIPKDVSELQSFIGLVVYYAKFFSNLSTVMTPLYNLLKKNVTWHWDKEQNEAFQKCKDLLTDDSVLVHYDPSLPVVLACDASLYGIGCVLSHNVNGVEKPIAFYSRTLKPAEKKLFRVRERGISSYKWCKKISLLFVWEIFCNSE